MKIKNPILDSETLVRCGILVDPYYTSLIKARMEEHELKFVKDESDGYYMVMEGKMTNVKEWFDVDSYWKDYFDDSTLYIKNGEVWEELEKKYVD